ncbi:MAG: DUF2490 domain-containing protein [Pirellulaceae bacterium]|nr:DUF2490 domain-containing protein [Pirellulaceae bacterium]
MTFFVQRNKMKTGGLNLFVMILFCSLVGLPMQFCRAETVNDFGSWFSVNTQGVIDGHQQSSRWRWWFDGHLRYLDDSDGFHQSIFRPGIGYQLTPTTNLWLGYAWINTMPANGNSLIDENRIWQQLMWTKKVGRQTLFSRTRLEQRFVETGSDTGWRLRQFCKINRPFCEGSPGSFVAWDEGFFGLNATDWGQSDSFLQNRLFLGLGLRLNGANQPKIEVGYLNQFIRSGSREDRMNHILSLNWFWNF